MINYASKIVYKFHTKKQQLYDYEGDSFNYQQNIRKYFKISVKFGTYFFSIRLIL